jgi:hypothetical protein|tara:strand:+ start:1182 stop:1595 length:414 start_codon:yes stop_codon:yes gene_type:complete
MTTVNAKKGELVELVNGLFSVKDLKGKTFGLAVGKNIKVLMAELKPLEDLSAPSEKFVELAKEIHAIANADTEESQAKIDKLEEENKEIVETRKSQLDVLKAAMEEDSSVELHTVPEEDLPEDITADQINNIDKIII